MKKYQYNDPVWDDNGNIIDNKIVTITEEQILNIYWEQWKSRMDNKWGVDHELTTKENCIDDWTVVFWAWEVKDA